MRELFVYYRVRAAEATAALATAQAFQTSLRALHPGLNARLMRRPLESNGAQTWMETYAIDGGIGAALQAQIEAAAAASLQPLIDGPRHTEVFVPCAS